ncbi:MAG: phosphodiester glycosidase family protein [Aphanothece sp. CMT-3BRIN-NPC111]|nr:phosphodiester glycosidase family protein [Aphanothece sp. CMT-3BRIN-NPC111]
MLRFYGLSRKSTQVLDSASVTLSHQLRYDTYTLQSSIVYVLRIPANSGFSVAPAVSHKLDTLKNFAQKHRAIAVLNAGFFDPNNQKSTSFLIQQGHVVADPRENKQMMRNPRLAPYLNKILNRTEFRRYICGSTIRYDITLHRNPPLAGCRLIDAIGGGPRLLPELTSTQEGFFAAVKGQVIRDPLASSQPNARTAIGITETGTIIWVMVAQKPDAPSRSGMSLTVLASFLKKNGAQKAMNLDGGSSSSMYYKGQTFYGKVNASGNVVKREVKSVLLLQRG